jgi:hypothetical protein
MVWSIGRRDGGSGRRGGLKNRCPQGRGGSNPPLGTRIHIQRRPYGNLYEASRIERAAHLLDLLVTMPRTAWVFRHDDRETGTRRRWEGC